MQPFEYAAPGSLDQALALLAASPGQTHLLAGGTDLLPQLREGRRRADRVIDLKHIPELTAITYHPELGLRLGAAAACYTVCHDPAVIQHYPGVVDGLHVIGAVQIQFRATVGGNLCNASPAADSIPALLVHAAMCVIAGPEGTRTLPVEAFCVAPGRTALRPGEILTAVTLSPPPPHFGAHYLRFIPRNEMDIAVVGAAAAVTLTPDGRHFQSARLALGAVAATPLLIPEAGAYLAGRPVQAETLAEAARLAQAAAQPIDDVRGTADFRRHLSAVLMRRALEGAVERARA
ncbi:MAG: xanthine dehydrogenase family protein subunit M [Anaerolineales bacterium]|nr:xanthine dehydrogenase family protein subunit M [Anaerolineales bacterium]